MRVYYRDPRWREDADAAAHQARARALALRHHDGASPPTLHLHDLPALRRLPDEVAELPHLQRVWIFADERGQRKLRGGHQLEDCAPLAGLTQLQELDLFETRVADLGFTRALTRLEELWLPGTRVTDLTPIAGLTRLRILNVSNTRVADLSPVAGLRELREIYLTRTGVTDLSPLAGLAALETLFVNHTAVSDLGPVQGLPQLRDLHADHRRVPDR